MTGVQRHRRHVPAIPRFTIADVRSIYEAIWGMRLDPGNFQRKMTGLFTRVENTQDRRCPGRPPPCSPASAEPPITGKTSPPIEPPLRRPNHAT